MELMEALAVVVDTRFNRLQYIATYCNHFTWRNTSRGSNSHITQFGHPNKQKHGFEIMDLPLASLFFLIHLPILCLTQLATQQTLGCRTWDVRTSPPSHSQRLLLLGHLIPSAAHPKRAPFAKRRWWPKKQQMSCTLQGVSSIVTCTPIVSSNVYRYIVRYIRIV